MSISTKDKYDFYTNWVVHFGIALLMLGTLFLIIFSAGSTGNINSKHRTNLCSLGTASTPMKVRDRLKECQKYSKTKNLQPQVEAELAQYQDSGQTISEASLHEIEYKFMEASFEITDKTTIFLEARKLAPYIYGFVALIWLILPGRDLKHLLAARRDMRKTKKLSETMKD